MCVCVISMKTKAAAEEEKGILFVFVLEAVKRLIRIDLESNAKKHQCSSEMDNEVSNHAIGTLSPEFT